MGYDVGTYTTFKKEKRIFNVFKIAERFKEEERDDRSELLQTLHNLDLLDEFDVMAEKYIFNLTGYTEYIEQEQEDLEHCLSLSKQFLELIQKTDLIEKENSFALWIKEKVEQGYAIGKSYVNEYGYFCFNEFEEKEKIDFITDGYIDILFPNGEIPRLFDKLEKEFNVELRKYLINEDNFYFNDNIEEVEKMISYDVNEAIATVKSIYDKVTDMHDIRILIECLMVWEQGGRFEYNR